MIAIYAITSTGFFPALNSAYNVFRSTDSIFGIFKN